MKKLLSFLLIPLLLLPLFAFTGCHGARKTNAFEAPETFDESRSFEITFWAKNDTNKTQMSIYMNAISSFEALYPNITVKPLFYTDYGRIYNDVITNISTGTTPNVCITYPDHIATYMAGENTVVPLDALFTDEKYGLGGKELRFDGPGKDEIVPKFLDECVIGGMHYALPYMRSTEACYVNKTYVEALGYTLPETLTWDFIWEVSEKAMEKDENGNFKVNGQTVMIPFIYKSTDNMMIQYLRQKGAGYSTDSADILIFNDDTKAFLYEIEKHARSRAFSTFQISSYPGNYLNAGQCIFAVDSTAGATWMGGAAPMHDISADRMVDFELEVMTIPQVDTAHPQMISQGPSVCIFNKEDPQEVLASWLFMQFLLTNDTQIAYAQTEGYIPVTTKAQQSPEYIDYLTREGEDDALHYTVKLEATKLLLNNIGNTFVTPVFRGSASLRSAAGQLVENVSKSARRGESVNEKYMEKLYSDVSSLYRLDQISPNEEVRVGGPLPTTAVILLSSLAGVWILIGVFALFSAIRKKKREKNTK